MYTVSWIIGKMYFLVTLVAGTLFAGFRLPRRTYFALRFALSMAVLVGEAFLWRFAAYTVGLRTYSPVGLLDFFVQYLIVILAMWLCFDINFWAALFCGTVGYCLEHGSERPFEILKNLFMREWPLFPQYLVRTVIFAAVSVLVYFLLMRRSKYYKCAVMVDNKMQTVSAFCIVAMIIFVSCMAVNAVNGIVPDNADRQVLVNYIYLMSALFAFVGLMLEFGLSSNKSKDEELSVIKQMLSDEREQFAREKANVELLNMKCHDIRHQIRNMRGDMDEEAVRELTDTINVYDSRINTGNEAINVVLAKYNLYCIKNDIKLTCLIDGGKLNFIPQHEIYSLFGNAVENAVHAVERLEPDKRIISITETSVGRFANISVTNFYDGELSFREGLPVSDREGHGFGVRSMRMIAEKYGGRLSVKRSGELFVLDIFLPLADAEECERESGVQISPPRAQISAKILK